MSRKFDEYISAVTASVRSDFKANLENLEEDAAIAKAEEK